MPSPFSPIVCVDFDGTCVTHAYPAIGEDIGAVPYLKALSDAGVRLILWTMRSGDKELPDLANPGKTIPSPLQDAIAWFAKNEIKLWGINENPEQKTWTSSRKAYAQIYVDDAGAMTPLKTPNEAWSTDSRPFVDWSVMGPWLLDKCGVTLASPPASS